MEQGRDPNKVEFRELLRGEEQPEAKQRSLRKRVEDLEVDVARMGEGAKKAHDMTREQHEQMIERLFAIVNALQKEVGIEADPAGEKRS